MGAYMEIAPIALLLEACKVEEHACSVIQFVQLLEYYLVKGAISCPSLINRTILQGGGGELTAAIRHHLLLSERMILKCLGFALYSYSDYPHKYTPSLSHRLGLPPSSMQIVWNVCNDSLLVDRLVIDYSGLEMAWAAILMSVTKKMNETTTTAAATATATATVVDGEGDTIKAIEKRCLEQLSRMKVDRRAVDQIQKALEDFYSSC
eukprot:scaffold4811_cov175-Ochromonas_danica.AAC.2